MKKTPLSFKDIKENLVENAIIKKQQSGIERDQKQKNFGDHTTDKPCEMCVGYNGIKRSDNIYVCDFCDDIYPIKE